MLILSINSGSSSLKCKLFSMPKEQELYSGHVDGIGLPTCKVIEHIETANIEKKIIIKDHNQAINQILNNLLEYKIIKSKSEIDAIGHRVVHGGEKYSKPIKLTKRIITDIEKLSSLAPLHNPVNILGIKACIKSFKCPNYAIFDTSFHQTIPTENYIYAIPKTYYTKDKIRKYGFHGISHEYVSKKAIKLLKQNKFKSKNIITCHIGNGASLSAIQNGKSINTTMGYTPLDGTIMGTRPGSIDPGVVLELCKLEGLKSAEKILNKESGIKGLTKNPDMRILYAKYQNQDKNAIQTMNIIASRLAEQISIMLTSLGSIDAIIFTAGLGENAFYLREFALNKLKFLDIKINKTANKKNKTIITKKESKVQVLVLPTNEELMIAKHVYNLK